MPATLALAFTVDAPPDVLGVVRVTVATPLASVSAVFDPPEKAPNSGSVLKVTMALGTPAPLPLVSVAVSFAGLVLEIASGRLDPKGKRIVGICTGHGLKDADIVTKDMDRPLVLAPRLDALEEAILS